MHVLTTSTGNQSLKISPRKDVSSPTLSLTDKAKRTTSNVSVTKTNDGDYMVLTGTFSLTDGDQYTFRVKDGSEEVYRGLILCTDQTDLDNFFVSKDEYIEQDSYDNDFVIL